MKRTATLAPTMALGLVLAACSAGASADPLVATGIVAQFPDRFAA